MASNAVACIGQRSACAVRATRLDSTCAAATGAAATVVTAGLVTMTATPDIEEGQRFEPKNACGTIMWTAEDPTITKRYTITAEFCTWDYELVELLTDAAILIGPASTTWATKAMGIALPGSSTTIGNGVALEIWSKTAGATGVCGAVSTLPPYVRHIFPYCLLHIDDHTFADDVSTLKLSGTANANSLWGVGPYGDWQGPVAGVPADSPYTQVYSAALPTTGCGFTS